jgi:hypothetical protein
MQKHQGWTVIRRLWLLVLTVSTGCGNVTLPPDTPVESTSSVIVPTAAPTPTLEQLQLINGKVDACLLLNVSEVENILGTRVSAKEIAFEGATACQYITTSGEPQVVLLTIVFTDATLREAGKTYTAAEWFDQEKMVTLRVFEQISTVEIQDVPDIGDKAYYKDGSFTDIYILQNGVEYVLSTRTPEFGGIGSVDALIALAKLAMRRAP